VSLEATTTLADGTAATITDRATMRTTNDSIAVVDDGELVGLHPGETAVVLEYGGDTSRWPVDVEGDETDVALEDLAGDLVGNESDDVDDDGDGEAESGEDTAADDDQAQDQGDDTESGADTDDAGTGAADDTGASEDDAGETDARGDDAGDAAEDDSGADESASDRSGAGTDDRDDRDDTDDTDDTGGDLEFGGADGSPGFGLLAAVVAIASGLALGRRGSRP